MRILNQKHGNLTADDRAELLKLLGKAGYAVRIGRTKHGKTMVACIEFWGDEDKREGNQDE